MLHYKFYDATVMLNSDRLEGIDRFPLTSALAIAQLQIIYECARYNKLLFLNEYPLHRDLYDGSWMRFDGFTWIITLKWLF